MAERYPLTLYGLQRQYPDWTRMASNLPSVAFVKGNRAKRDQVEFMGYTWRKRNQPLLVGHHTSIICNVLDNALQRYRNGKSTFLMIKVPFRHGKSEIISRYFPCRFIGEFPDDEVIICSYGASLSYSFSKFARKIMESSEYKMIYPDVQLSRHNRSVEEWGIDDHMGVVHYAGLGGAITGKGGNLLILDDFFKGREEAESATIREKRWEAFANDFITRAADPCIAIILATPWHKDDIFGRIKQHMKEEPDFPYFREMKFPAFSDKYKTGTLFPERFSNRYYRAMSKVLGTYGTASLLQCEPVSRHGNMLRTDKIHEINPSEYPRNLHFVRGYDLASSEKERTKEDPDYTVGVKLAVRWLKTGIEGLYLPEIYIDDIVRGRWEAAQRQKRIIATAVGDRDLPIGIEAFGAYKDAYTLLKKLLSGARAVTRINLPGDKVAKAGVLEPPLEAGNVYVRKGAPWVHTLKTEFADFPSGKHDDIVDACCVAIELTRRSIRAERMRW